jgi:hypothetical protein
MNVDGVVVSFAKPRFWLRWRGRPGVLDVYGYGLDGIPSTLSSTPRRSTLPAVPTQRRELTEMTINPCPAVISTLSLLKNR